jgi:hypothetical protein
MRTIHVDDYLFYRLLKMIDEGDINEVIDYAKKERLYVEQINTWQRCFIERIKERLDREGLSHEIIRPNK